MSAAALLLVVLVAITVLYEFVNGLQDEAWFKPMLGGLGAYDRTASHGPFVHVDVRGFLAHWGA